MAPDLRSLSRRDLLRAAGAGAVGAVAAGRILGAVGVSQPAPAAAAAAMPQWRSRPDLRIPSIDVVRNQEGVSPEPIFIAPYNSPVGQAGAVITGNDGEAIWEHPLDGLQMTDFRVQVHEDRPVLTWWEGKVELGHGVGHYVVLDTSYRTVRTLNAANGLRGDLHEFLITPDDTALLTSYVVRSMDLSPVGGPRNGTIQDAIFQEVDLATGRALSEWRSLEHVDMQDSYAGVTEDWDYFHVNSIDLDSDGHLLVSARSMHTIYKIDRSSGEILWRLGGKRSDFAMRAGTRFAWQHDARRRPDGILSVFDNGASPAVRKLSRALLLEVDEPGRTVSLAREYTHPGILSQSQGNMQVLPNGNVFVGWGQEPYISEFDASGTLLFDARLGASYQSYRAFRLPWAGEPAEDPALAVTRARNHVQAFASWNGASDVAAWRLLGADSRGALQPVATVPYEGFETSISVLSRAHRFRVEALDASGAVLGRSARVESTRL